MICDKCGKSIEPGQCALALTMLEAYGKLPTAFEYLAYSTRHILPTEECEGSPSRAQYLEGQPRDTREYPYVPEREASFRKAYAKLQEVAGQ